jgi:hypothetical protein
LFLLVHVFFVEEIILFIDDEIIIIKKKGKKKRPLFLCDGKPVLKLNHLHFDVGRLPCCCKTNGQSILFVYKPVFNGCS